jgi:hypothetical protein
MLVGLATNFGIEMIARSTNERDYDGVVFYRSNVG